MDLKIMIIYINYSCNIHYYIDYMSCRYIIKHYNNSFFNLLIIKNILLILFLVIII
jgi:hypothetical protein